MHAFVRVSNLSLMMYIQNQNQGLYTVEAEDESSLDVQLERRGRTHSMCRGEEEDDHSLYSIYWVANLPGRPNPHRSSYTANGIIRGICFLCTVCAVCTSMTCRRGCFLLAAACAASGHGDAGEPAGSGAKPVRALPLLKLLYRGRRRQRSACPVPAPHGDALRQHVYHAPRAAAADGRRRRRGGLLAADGRDRILLALLVEAATERARVVRRGAHAGPTDLGGGLDRRAGDGELDTGERGGLVVGEGA